MGNRPGIPQQRPYPEKECPHCKIPMKIMMARESYPPCCCLFKCPRCGARFQQHEDTSEGHYLHPNDPDWR